MLKALIFDVDGTLADTEDAHRIAFNAAFRDAGLAWHWSRAAYAGLLAVAGGKERIRAYWRHYRNKRDPSADAVEADAIVDALHARKTLHYARLVEAGRLPLRPGILRLIHEAREGGVRLAIATTTTPANVDALLRAPLGKDWRALFAAVCDAGTVPDKKPAPDVYRAALAQLDLPAADCLALEDSANGLRAACAAGIPALVTPTGYTRGQDFDGALACLDHVGDLAMLRRWHATTRQEAR